MSTQSTENGASAGFISCLRRRSRRGVGPLHASKIRTGICFGLEGFDEVRRSLELRRRAHAEKLESERRAAQELEIAKQVQARLFPQIQPQLKTLECAGICLQARQVGGDYFDFLSLGPNRLGMIIGDVSGKGIAAALLMANLQASLRSQSALAFEQPEALLRSVNRLF